MWTLVRVKVDCFFHAIWYTWTTFLRASPTSHYNSMKHYSGVGEQLQPGAIYSAKLELMNSVAPNLAQHSS